MVTAAIGTGVTVSAIATVTAAKLTGTALVSAASSGPGDGVCNRAVPGYNP